MSTGTPSKKAPEQSSKPKAVVKSIEPEKVAMVSGWLGINPDVLDNPDLAMTKELIHVYAKRLASKEKPDDLKGELIAMFDNPVGKHALALATNTAVDSATIAATVGEAAGQRTRRDMKLAFNAGFSRGLLTPDEYEIPQSEKLKLTLLQVDNALNALSSSATEPPKQIAPETPQ